MEIQNLNFFFTPCYSITLSSEQMYIAKTSSVNRKTNHIHNKSKKKVKLDFPLSE